MSTLTNRLYRLRSRPEGEVTDRIWNGWKSRLPRSLMGKRLFGRTTCRSTPRIVCG